MKASLRFNWPMKRWTALALAFALVMSAASGVANAADDVTGIEFKYDDEDYDSGTKSLNVRVEDDKVELAVYASVSGSSSQQDVTSSATWKSSNSSAVKVDKVSIGSRMNWTVSSKTLATVSGSSVKALAVGSGKVTGTYQGKKVTVKLVVVPKLKSLSLSERSAQLSPGATFSVKLQANYTTGSPVDATSSAVWTTSRSSVAAVSGGKITAVAKGSATIKASYEGKTVTFRVTVK